jgi:hypothetical protein
MRCPVCRADNNQPPSCRRCRADLTLLFALEEQRRHAVVAAGACLARGRLGRALDLARGAAALRRGDDAERLLAVIHVLRRDFREAWRLYRGRSASGMKDE